MNYILASTSPRRKELLHQAGFEFSVLPSNADETITGENPSEIVMELASRKSKSALDTLQTSSGFKDYTDFSIIGADTIVVYRDEILGKPCHTSEAFDMLSMLSDRTHQVYTGVSIIVSKNKNLQFRTFFECTDVTLYPISRQELSDYIATGDSFDKAGGYGIQGRFAVHIKCIHGDYNNVVGLPIARLYQELLQL